MTGSADAAQQPAGLLHLGTFVAGERGKVQPHCLGHLAQASIWATRLAFT